MLFVLCTSNYKRQLDNFTRTHIIDGNSFLLSNRFSSLFIISLNHSFFILSCLSFLSIFFSCSHLTHCNFYCLTQLLIFSFQVANHSCLIHGIRIHWLSLQPSSCWTKEKITIIHFFNDIFHKLVKTKLIERVDTII